MQNLQLFIIDCISSIIFTEYENKCFILIYLGITKLIIAGV